MSLLPVPGGPADAIEYAGELLERHEAIDNSAPTLMEVRNSLENILVLFKHNLNEWKSATTICCLCGFNSIGYRNQSAPDGHGQWPERLRLPKANDVDE